MLKTKISMRQNQQRLFIHKSTARESPAITLISAGFQWCQKGVSLSFEKRILRVSDWQAFVKVGILEAGETF